MRCKIKYGTSDVSVHLVGTRTTCQPTPMSRTIAVHEYRASFLPGAVGPDPSCGPGLHPCPRSPCGGVGGHRPAVGSDGPAHNRAAAARLAHLVAASVERSTPGPRQAATARTQWASARWAARPRGDRKSTRLNSSHTVISYAVFCLKKKK